MVDVLPLDFIMYTDLLDMRICCAGVLPGFCFVLMVIWLPVPRVEEPWLEN